MPLENFGNRHFTPDQIQQIDAALGVIENIFSQVSINLSDEERQRFGSVNEQNKLIVNKIYDYYKTQPHLASPDVNWEEFMRDFASREFAYTRLQRLNSIVRMLSDFKIAHDFDNYQAALRDHAYTKYKAETNAVGFTEKEKDVKQLFPNG